MSQDGDKGLWASFIDGLMRALAGAFIAVAGGLIRDNMEVKENLREAQANLAKQREVARRRADPAERDRVRDKYKD